MESRFDKLCKELDVLKTELRRMESNNPKRIELAKAIERLNERINRLIEY